MMKILIFGNLGSGKSTLLNEMRKLFGWDVVSIDEFRRKYGDGSIENEYVARAFFFKSIIPHKNQFIETTGIGEVARELYIKLSETNEKVYCIILDASKKICKKRLKYRKWDIPFPNPIYKVDMFIDKVDELIAKGSIQKLWENRKNTEIFFIRNSTNEEFTKAKKILIMIIRDILRNS